MNNSLDLYKYFYTVANCGNISEAAKALFTSQPVVSKYIQRLEQELNVQLFIRKSRGVLLTEEGQILYEHVKTALEAFQTGTDEIQRKQQLGAGRIRIGVSTTLCKYLLLPYLKTYIEKNPNVQVSIQCQSTNHTLELLEQGKIDIGLIGKPDQLGNMRFFEMLEIHDIFVASNTYLHNHKLSDKTTTRELFSHSTVMLLDKTNITRQYIDTYLSHNNIIPTNLLEISSMDLIIDFARISMGIGCVIKEFVHDDLAKGTLVEVPIYQPIPQRKVGFVIKNQGYMPIALKLFIELMAFTLE